MKAPPQVDDDEYAGWGEPPLEDPAEDPYDSRLPGQDPPPAAHAPPRTDPQRPTVRCNKCDTYFTSEDPPSRRLPNLPESFWRSRPWLTDLRRYAHHLTCPADAVLGAALAGYVASLGAQFAVETGIATPVPMSMFVGLVGDSGGSKSASRKVAGTLFEGTYLERGLPSGPGLVEAFIHTAEVLDPAAGEPAKVRQQKPADESLALFHVDEGEVLLKSNERAGETIGGVLRAAWSAGQIGTANASADRDRSIEADAYTVALIAGFQPEAVQPLLAETALGSAQRWLWVSTTDPAVRLVDDITRPAVPLLVPPSRSLSGLTKVSSHSGRTRYVLSVEPSISTRLRAEAVAVVRGEVRRDPKDSQKPALVARLAGVFALLDDRGLVTEEDWSLAEQLYTSSAAVRDQLIEYGEADARELLRQASHRQGLAYRDRDNVGAEITRVATVLWTRANKTGSATKRDLRRAIASRDKELFADALERAVERGWLMVDGDRYIAVERAS